MWTVEVDDVEAMQMLGHGLALAAVPGIVIALVGELGAGKTTFAQGVGVGLGVEQSIVSPTFVVMAEYAGRLPLLHADTYRLSAGELPGVGLEETIDACGGVSLVEWADKFPDMLPDDHLRVHIAFVGDHRRLTVQAMGPRARAVLSTWSAGHDQ